MPLALVTDFEWFTWAGLSTDLSSRLTVAPVLAQAQYAAAEPYYEHALLMERELQWSETPQVSVGLDHLARTAAAQGRGEEAEEMYQWALGISERALGSESANTIFLRRQYGRYLRAQGLDEADSPSRG